jgi:DNA repair photolyase
MPQIISASRRTDIPAFYSEWFVNRLKAGSVYVQQPYTRKLFRVSLRPEDVSAIVFWSKNYAPLLNKLDKIEQTTKNLYFHFTITANQELELHTPAYKDAVRDYIFLSQRYSAEQLAWRFDPICLTDKLPFEAYEKRFVQCAERLKGHTRHCIISFAHPYKKTIANLQKYAQQAMLELSEEKKKEYALRLAARAEQYGIRLFACCNDYLVSDSILKARCIDGHALSEIFKTPLDTRTAASRKECGCAKSTDLGAYDTCAHGCLYCYANADTNKAITTRKRHNPEWNALMMQVDEIHNTQRRGQTTFPY